jgi:transposase
VAHFVRELVRGELDLSGILDTYQEERGYPPFHPVMMTALLLYGYSQGIYSSRRIARGCEERVDFMAVTAMQTPDFRTIARFRKRHLAALSQLFVQVLHLCQKAGLVKLGHVALDGTKVKANASKHKAMSYGRMKSEEPRLAQEVERWLKAAEEVDTQEDQEFGSDRRGDELPSWVTNKQERVKKIRQAMAELEAEAQEKARAREKPDDSFPGQRRGRKPKHPPGTPPDKAQRNFTDPESRIMKTGDGYVQAYNGQAAVDADSQVIVAQSLDARQNDHDELPEILRQIKANTGRQVRELSADANYCSESNLKALGRHHVTPFLATGRQKHGTASATGSSRRTAPERVADMRRRLRQGGHRSRYRLRKQTVEPVFGQIKEARGFRRFLLRGLGQVRAEWSLVCTAHNLLKLAMARSG